MQTFVTVGFMSLHTYQMSRVIASSCSRCLNAHSIHVLFILRE